jgi:hypothetical protein
MNDGFDEPRRPEDRISLSDLYELLPEAAAAADGESYDVDAGLDELHRWIADAGTDATATIPHHAEEPDPAPQPGADATDDIDELFGVGDLVTLRHLNLKVAAHPTDREAAFAMRRLKVLARLELKRLRMQQRHTFEMRQLDEELRLKEVESEHRMRLEARAQPVRLLLQVLAVLGVVAGYIAAVIYNVSTAYVGLHIIVAGYMVMLMTSVTAATRSKEPDRRRHAYQVLLLLLGKRRLDQVDRDSMRRESRHSVRMDRRR